MSHQEFGSFLHSLKDKMIAEKLVSPEEIKGVDDDAIRGFESYLNLSFPLAYKEFLSQMGSSLGRLWRGESMFAVDFVPNQADFREFLAEDQPQLIIPNDAVVVYSHQGYEFQFVLCSHGSNPPVFLVAENMPGIRLGAWTFTQFLEGLVDNSIAFRAAALKVRQKRS